MESIRAIQEVIDEHKEELPTGVVTSVMSECQKAYHFLPKLYKLTWTIVDSHAHIEEAEDEPDFPHVELTYKTQTLIVEAVDHQPDTEFGGKMKTMKMPHHGMVFKPWVNLSMPQVLMDDKPYGSKDYMHIIHSIVPYEPRKRALNE